MKCPFCNKDNKDVPVGYIIGHVSRTDDHYYKNYIRRGRHCTNCGETFETIERATGEKYYKKILNK